MQPVLHAILTRMIRRGALTVLYPDGERRTYRGATEGPEAAVALRTPQRPSAGWC
jgi:cyclopropane-fatty-acyl-phospholipid synthase